MSKSALFVLALALTAWPCLADALDSDLINSPGLQVLRPAAAAPVFEPAAPVDAPTAPETTTEVAELSISTDGADFEVVQTASPPVFGVAPRADDQAPVPDGVPTAPTSAADAERIRIRNQEAKQWATRTGYFKFIVDKDTSTMLVMDGTTKVGEFSISYGSNKSDDSYGSSGSRNTPIGVFITHAGRPSNAQFTWFIPYDVPGRVAMGIHGPKDTFLGGFLGLIHWTAGCIATHSRADILKIKAAHAIALKRGTPTRLIIGRGIDFRTIPGY